MILDNQNTEKPHIEYPCEWTFKLIGTDVKKIIEATEETCKEMKYDIQASNISKKGNYFSLSLIVFVESENQRNYIYSQLGGFEFIKFVL